LKSIKKRKNINPSLRNNNDIEISSFPPKSEDIDDPNNDAKLNLHSQSNYDAETYKVI